MKFDVDDKNRCRLVCVKFHLNRCRFAAAVAKCLGGSLFGTQCMLLSQYEFLYSSLVIKLQSLRCPWCSCSCLSWVRRLRL